MIREMEGDAPDKDFAADMTISTYFDNTFCLQSDAFLTKYSKANVQIAKEQAAIFTVSIQVFHRELLLALAATGNAEEL